MATSSPQTLMKPEPSALSEMISSYKSKTEREALPMVIKHNLQYQHGWKDLKIYNIRTPSSSTLSLQDASFEPLNTKQSKPGPINLISGLPKRHSYIHPDFQAHLIKHDLSESSLPIQREWVLPMTIGEKWTLRQFSSVFDVLEERVPLKGQDGFQLKEGKRLILAMLAQNGMGGDGTVAYYIMQEGEVKPRQNG